jgi:serine/threonine protein kinase
MEDEQFSSEEYDSLEETNEMETGNSSHFEENIQSIKGKEAISGSGRPTESHEDSWPPIVHERNPTAEQIVDKKSFNHAVDCEYCKLQEEYEEDSDDSKFLEFIEKKLLGKAIKTKVGEIKLTKILTKGGESVIFNTNKPEYIAKVGDCEDEIESLKKIKSKFVLQPVDSGKLSIKFKNTDDIYYIILPKMCCCLDDIIDDKELAILGILEIAKAIDEIHDSKIIHSDISPSNIMLKCTGKDTFSFYVIDFGLSEPYTFDLTINPKYKNEGNLDYMSKEQHIGFKHKPYKSDYQNFFYCLYSIFCKLPWRHSTSAPEIYQLKSEFKPKYFFDFYGKIMRLDIGKRLALFEETKNALKIE